MAIATFNFPNAFAAPAHRDSRLRTSPKLLAGQCRVAGGRVRRVEWKLRVAQAALGGGDRAGTEEVWCGLCGDRGGWLTCGRCVGEGGFPTRPGLAGVKGRVGWARCKTCFGHTVIPCLFCGVSGVSEWKLWLEDARRHPHRSHKQVHAP